MNPLKSIVAFVKHEPAILLSLVGAGIAVGADYGLHLNANDTKILFGAVTAMGGVVIRQAVVPNVKVAKQATTVETRLSALEAVANNFVPVAVKPEVSFYEKVVQDALTGAISAQTVVAPVAATAVAALATPAPLPAVAPPTTSPVVAVAVAEAPAAALPLPTPAAVPLIDPTDLHSHA